MGSCGRPHASFATRWSECDSRRVHYGLVQQAASFLGRERVRMRLPAGPPGVCLRKRCSPARSGRRCDSGHVHHAGLFKEAPPLVSASRRERYPRPAPPNDHGDHGPLVRAPVRFDSGVRLSWVGNVSLVQPTSVPALFPRLRDSRRGHCRGTTDPQRETLRSLATVAGTPSKRCFPGSTPGGRSGV